MAKKYIDADAFEAILKDRLYKVMERYGVDSAPTGITLGTISLLESQPPADVAETRRGEWFPLDECSNEGIYCSRCRKKVFHIDYSNTMKKWKSFKYCPNCGSYNGG